MLKEFLFSCFYIAIWTGFFDVLFGNHTDTFIKEFITSLPTLLYFLYVIVIGYQHLSPRFASFYPVTKLAKCAEGAGVTEAAAKMFVVFVVLFAFSLSYIIDHDVFYAILNILPVFVALYLETKNNYKATVVILCILAGKYKLSSE